MRIGKRGSIYDDTRKMFYFGIVFFILLFSGIIVTSFFFKFADTKLYTPEETFVAMYYQRLIGSPDCFAYKDPFDGRVEIGVLDPDKIDQEVLRSCYEDVPGNLKLQVDIAGKSMKTSDSLLQVKNRYAPIFVWLKGKDGSMQRGKLSIATG